jgi:hypothetical protein
MNRFQKQPRNSPNEHEMDRREQRLIYRGVTWYNKRVWLEENVMMLGKILKFMRVHRGSVEGTFLVLRPMLRYFS